MRKIKGGNEEDKGGKFEKLGGNLKNWGDMRMEGLKDKLIEKNTWITKLSNI